jgi:hypothetical protein
MQGLFTLFTFLIFRSLRSYFIPEMLMGFPSQSFCPDSKLCNPFGLSLLPCSLPPGRFQIPVMDLIRTRIAAPKLYSLKREVPCRKVIKLPTKSLCSLRVHTSKVTVGKIKPAFAGLSPFVVIRALIRDDHPNSSLGFF